MRFATRVIRAGLPDAAQGEPFRSGPTFASVYHVRGDPAQTPFGYGREANPTWSAYESALTDLEGGPAVVFGSGMAAVDAIFGTFLRRGRTLVIPSDCYYGSRRLAHEYAERVGIEVREVPTVGGALEAALDGAALVWLESPTNPNLDVCDLEHLATAAHAGGALVAVDNTTATCLGQQPLALGADLSMASDTKALSGHSDLVLGHVAARDSAHADALRAWRAHTGAVPGPMEVWLAHRSIATLELRLGRQSSNALAVARFLAGRPEVSEVRYPGLAGDPAHEVARRQMRFFGPIVSFTLAGREEAERFLAASELIAEATSFGGIHTTAERRARWGGDAVPEGFIRLSAGCEDPDDLVADFEAALGAIGQD